MNTIILRKLNSLISLDIQHKLSHFEEKIIIKLLKLLNEKKSTILYSFLGLFLNSRINVKKI